MVVWDFSGSGFTNSGETWDDGRSIEAIAADKGYVPAFTLGRRFAAHVFTKPHPERGEYQFVVGVTIGAYEHPVRVISFPRLVDLLSTLAPIIRADADHLALHGPSSPAANGTPAVPPEPAPAEPRPEPASAPFGWLGG